MITSHQLQQNTNNSIDTMKLGSNRKSIGMGAGYREFSYDNKRVKRNQQNEILLSNFSLIQIGFGFCKGDDNFGGQRRKELDDFTKSLGKQMNLVMKRMEETKKIRMRLRERQLEEIERKYRKKELEGKLQLERISRNQEWRERKKFSGSYSHANFFDDLQYPSNRQLSRFQ